MPRAPEFRAVHEQADRIEPRLARALGKATDRMRSLIPFAPLAEAIAARDERGAARIIAEMDIEDTLVPSEQILRDAFLKGGKTIAKELNDE